MYIYIYIHTPIRTSLCLKQTVLEHETTRGSNPLSPDAEFADWLHLGAQTLENSSGNLAKGYIRRSGEHPNLCNHHPPSKPSEPRRAVHNLYVH